MYSLESILQRKSRAKHGHGTKECWAGIDYMYRQSAGRNGFRTECERHGVECGEKLMRKRFPAGRGDEKSRGNGQAGNRSWDGAKKTFCKM